MKVRHLLLTSALPFLLGISLSIEAFAGCCQGWQGSEISYNRYCANPRWGWYGSRKSVGSAAEARRDLSEFYAGSDMQIGKIKERSAYFEAEILDRDNTLADRVIIHKQSGRIRSIQ